MRVLGYLSKLEERMKLSPYENNSLVPSSKFFKRMAIENFLISTGIGVYYNLTNDIAGSEAMTILLIYNLYRWNSLPKNLKAYRSNSNRQGLRQ
jgi:hypothetical protein